MKPLEVKNLSKIYDKKLRALDDISFSLEKGEIFGLLGPNGSGKTTLISIISTLIQASQGEVHVFGEKVSRDNLIPKHWIGLVPQEIISHGFFTIDEILRFVSGYYGITNNQEHINYLLDQLALYEHRNKKVLQLSGGMKRRLLIAKALVHKPKLLLLDEPTAGVDIELRNSLWKFVESLNKDGCTILLTTHYLEEAENLCDRVGIINFGRLLRIGNTADIIHKFTEREFEVELSRPIENFKSPYLIENKGEILVFKVPSTMDFGDLLASIDLDVKWIKDFRIREGKLEDAFIRVLGEENASK